MPWIILFLFLVPLYGQTQATTSDGRAVILNEDGTWAYVPKVEPGEFTFRKTYWGMSRDEVKATEDIKVSREESTDIAYIGKVSNLDTAIIYYFAAQKLVKAGYWIMQKHSNENDYIRDYAVMKNALNEKYGTPTIDETEWKNTLYAHDKEKFGFAVGLGHLQFWSFWETDATKILLRLTGDNYEIALRLEYESKQLAPLLKAESKKESLSEF